MKRFFQPLRDFCRGEYRRFVFMAAAAFLAIALLAYLTGRFAPTLCDTVIGYFMDMIDSSAVMDDAGNFSAVGLFFNNLRAMVMTVLYGFIPFLFLPALSLGINAVILGVMAAYYSNEGISLLAFFAGILPHGVFELPALILSLAAEPSAFGGAGGAAPADRGRRDGGLCDPCCDAAILVSIGFYRSAIISL